MVEKDPKSGTEIVDAQELSMLRQFVLDKVELSSNIRLMWRDSVLGRTVRYCFKWMVILVSASLGISTGLVKLVDYLI